MYYTYTGSELTYLFSSEIDHVFEKMQTKNRRPRVTLILIL